MAQDISQDRAALPLWQVLTSDDLPAHPDPDDLVRRDVRDNLRIVLSTCRGRSSGHPEFGLQDLSHLVVSAGGASRVMRAVRDAIERWEPRLSRPIDVRVLPADKDAASHVIELSIWARLAAPYRGECRYEVTVHANGRVELS